MKSISSFSMSRTEDRRKRRIGFRLAFLVCASPFLSGLMNAGPAAADSPIIWEKQFGTPVDEGVGVVAFGNSVMAVAGSTYGDLYGANPGGSDAILSVYGAADGSPVWTKQFGTTADDNVYGLAYDAAGSLFACGETIGDLFAANAGGHDIWVAKYGPSGNQVWATQFGTGAVDESPGLAVDVAGYLYVECSTSGTLGTSSAGGRDAWLAKYDSDGRQIWMTQYGSSGSDYCQGIAVDPLGYVVTGGYTSGVMYDASAGGTDAWLAKYDADGTLVWGKQFGTDAADWCMDVAADADGNILACGETRGSLDAANLGDTDACVWKYDSDGNLLWSKQLGSTGHDNAYDVATDASGRVYVIGYTTGDMFDGAGEENAGGTDLWFAVFDSDGNSLFDLQAGTLADDAGFGIAVDQSGTAYLAGYTEGALLDTHQGGQDAFVVAARVPEPGSFTLLGVGLLGLLALTNRGGRRRR